jgi:hypothetical protein
MEACFAGLPGFAPIATLLRELAAAAKLESETMRSDPVIFRVWPRFVAAGEGVAGFRPTLPEEATAEQRRLADEALRLLAEGKKVIEYLAGARVPMPKTTANYHRRCDEFRATCAQWTAGSA